MNGQNNLPPVKKIPQTKQPTDKGLVPAQEVVNHLRSYPGGCYRANWTGAWDTASTIGIEGCAKVITINRGNGFEDAVEVLVPEGTFIYFGPFKMDQEPTINKVMLFYCTNALFIKG